MSHLLTPASDPCSGLDLLPCLRGGFCLLFGFVVHLHEIHTFLQSGICRLLPSDQCVILWAFDSFPGVLPQVSCSIFFLFNLWTFDSYSGVLSQVRCFILFLFCLVLLLLALLGFLINFFCFCGLCACVSFCANDLCLLSCKWRRGKAGVTMFFLLAVSFRLLQVCPFFWGSSHPPFQCQWCLFFQGHHLLWWHQATGLIGYYPTSTPHFTATGLSGATCPTLVPPKDSHHSQA